MERWKTEYHNIQVPKEVREKMEEAIKRAQESKKKAKKRRTIRYLQSAAAVIAIVLILPNTSQTVAAAMQQIPLLGDFFKVVTVREYQVEEDRYQADVKVPEVVPESTDTIPEETKEEAQNAPTPITTYALFLNGNYITNEQMNDKRFLKLLDNSKRHSR